MGRKESNQTKQKQNDSCSPFKTAFYILKKTTWIRWDATLHDEVILTKQWHHLTNMCVSYSTNNVKSSRDSLGKIWVG